MFKANMVDLIKDLRKKTNVSQEELANYIGVSRLTYVSAENWKRTFKEKEIKKIAEFFEKDLSYFLEENKNNKKKSDKNRRIKDLILYIAKNFESKESLWKAMLNKLLYFSDFNYCEWTWNLISGATYKKLPFGPVPKNINEILDEMVQDWEIVIQDETKFDYSMKKIIALKEHNLQTFEKIDRENRQEKSNYKPYEDLPTPTEIIDWVLIRFKNWTANAISELSHEDTPYKATKNYWDVIKPTHVFYRSKPFIVNPHNLEDEN